MRIVRRRLPWIIGAWLLGQAAAIASAPVALWRSPTAAVEDDCCPGVAPGQVCPMHHTTEGRRTCEMRNACASSSAALLALSGGTGLPAAARSVVASALVAQSLALPASPTLARADRPKSPPPRP